MDTPADRRFFGLCLLASVAGFGTWLLAFPKSSATWIFVIAVVVLAVLTFVDGYVAPS